MVKIFLIDDNKIKEKILELEDWALQKILTSLQIDYINQIGDEMKSGYLENSLSKEEIDLRQKIYGWNSLTEPKKVPWIIKYII
jgi:magnesium-transporting ATPase (P-type)